MEQQVFLRLFILGMLSAVQGSTTDFCNDGDLCPEFHLSSVQDYEEYEKREYVSTRWITTAAQSSATPDLMAAHQRLKAYCEGSTVPMNTWPVLITVTEEEDGSEKVSMSWFVGNDTALPNDPSIIEEFRPAATVYVKVFSSEVNREMPAAAEKMLGVLGNTAKPHMYSGAGYNSPWAIHQHNEVWVYAVVESN